jgi:hypothetical protein
MSGGFCERAKCQDEMCENGGRCIVLGNKAVCYCPPDFTGPKCQVSQVSHNKYYLTPASPAALNRIVIVSCLTWGYTLEVYQGYQNCYTEKAVSQVHQHIMTALCHLIVLTKDAMIHKCYTFTTL